MMNRLFINKLYQSSGIALGGISRKKIESFVTKDSTVCKYQYIYIYKVPTYIQFFKSM